MGKSSELCTLAKKVFCRVGDTVLRLLKARPSRPEEAVSERNALDTNCADSTACDEAVSPPTSTTSM
jgi:hypothetical protein